MAAYLAELRKMPLSITKESGEEEIELSKKW